MAIVVVTMAFSAYPLRAELPPSFDDESLVARSDVIILGQQVDPVTIEITEVLKGSWTEKLAIFPELAQYRKTIETGIKRKDIPNKLSSREIIVFINGRTLRPSLALGGVRRFSRAEQDGVVYRYRYSKQRRFHLRPDEKTITKANYLKQLMILIERDRTTYRKELNKKLRATDFSKLESARKFIAWVRQYTRWNYEEGIQALLQLAENQPTKVCQKAVWALRAIRDPASGPHLRGIINRSLGGNLPLFDHIRAVGFIGGDEAVIFLARLSTHEDTVRHHSEVSCAAVHGLRWLAQQYESESSQFDVIETAILHLNPKPICVRQALVTLATEKSIQKLELFASQMKGTDEILYQDAIEMVKKARKRMAQPATQPKLQPTGLELRKLLDPAKPLAEQVAAEIPLELRVERDRLLAEAEANIRTGLLKLAERFPVLTKAKAWGVYASEASRSEAGRIGINLYHTDRGKTATEESLPADKRFGITVSVHRPAKEKPQRVTVPLYPNLGLVGWIGSSAGAPDLDAALKKLLGESLAPLKELDVKAADAQPATAAP